MSSLSMYVTLSVLSFAVIVFETSATPDSELLSVVQIFRHGQRVPLSFYPNDPYGRQSLWDSKPGYLTKKGKFQLYELGVFTRNRYKNFLPSTYSDEDFYAYTSETERTHMSAQAFIAGLYPPTEADRWHEHLNWQPIPVHTTQYPPILITDFCPAYSEAAVNEIKRRYENLTSIFADRMDYIATRTGADISNPYEICVLYDTMFIEKDVGFELPEWIDSVYPKPLKYFTEMLIGVNTHSEGLTRLGLGPFLNTLVSRFEQKLEDPTKPSKGNKLMVFSGHDLNVVGLLRLLGYSYAPSFASSLYFELRKAKESAFINVYFKKDSSIIPLKIKDCELNCDLNDFKVLYRDYLIDEATFLNECQSKSDKAPNGSDCRVKGTGKDWGGVLSDKSFPK